MIKPMTEMNLTSAFAGESQAHMRYSVYSQRAEEGYPSMIRLFKAVAYTERVHAGNHYKNIQRKGGTLTFSGALFCSRSTVEGLQNEIDGRTWRWMRCIPLTWRWSGSRRSTPPR